MSTDRPKRNIIKKKYDISDGMPWCEERLVRKVLFLSLREFRDKHRVAHKHSHIHKRAHKRTSKNTPVHAPRKTLTLPNPQKKTYTRKNVQQQRVTCTPANTHTQKNTHKAQSMHISKHLHPHGRTNKGQKTDSSQDSHTPKSKCTHTLQNTQTQSKLSAGKAACTAQHTHLQQTHMFHKSSSSTRTLRSHKTQNTLSLLSSKYTEPAKHTHTLQHKHSVKNTQTLLSTPVPARTLRSHTPTNISGSLVNGISRCQSLLPAGPSWTWSLQTRPQKRRPASIHRDKDDAASKRPRLQAQRKFAQSPPSSPGPSVLTSGRSNHAHSLAVVTCLTRRRPKTEDFLSFLCLRGSAALPSNMAFLASKREKEPADTQRLSSCFSTNHKAAAGVKNSVFSGTTVQQDSRSLRRRPAGPAVVSPFCPLTARAQRRRERQEREENRQRRRKEAMEEDRREGGERHLLRPRQLSLQVRRTDKVDMVTRTSCVRSVTPSKPRTGVSSKQSPRPCTRPRSTCKPRRHPQSRPQETSKKHLSLHHNHQLPHTQHLPLHQTVSNYYSNTKTFSSLQNSGRNSHRTPAAIPLTNGSVVRQLGENPGVLRLSRRRRGLPPDTHPPSVAPLDKNLSKKCRKLQYRDGSGSLDIDCSINEVPQKKADGDKDVTEEYLSHMGKPTGSYEIDLIQDTCDHVGRVKLQSGICISEDLQDKVNVGNLKLASVTALEPSQERVSFTNAITNYDLTPVTEVICKHVREKTLQKTQPTTIPKPVTRSIDSRTVARAATARTSVTKAAINSVTSTYMCTEPPDSSSAKHTPKGTNKGTSKDITKCTLPASGYFAHNSIGAAKNSSKGTTEDKDSTPASSYCSTFKGSTKGLTQTKSTTSATKTRSSPRILLKR